MLRSLLATLFTAAAVSAQSLSGVIDVHTHSDPDGRPRSIDAVDLAKLAKARGMRGLVLKNHYESTASLAYIVNKEVPGLELAGGIALNLPVGGVNAAAVEWMAQVKGGFGRVVWMPTYDSEHHVTVTKEKRPFASVSRGGTLLPEVLKVLSVIAEKNMVLATGHSSPEEVLLLIQAAKSAGVKQIIVTHATATFVGMTLDQMKRAAAMGAFIEFCRAAPGSGDMKLAAEFIRAIGPASVILSSDLGQAGNPLHPDGLAAFFEDLKKAGFTQAEVDRMSKTNPAVLLGWKQ
jgi:Family of unknown function (DUF6282)